MRRAWLSFAAALAACSSGEDLIFVPAPDLGGAKAMLLAFTAGEQLQLQAFDPTSGELHLELPGRVGRGEQVVLEALLYDRTLAELGLTPGTISPATDPRRARPLDPARTVLRLGFEAGEPPGTWHDADLDLTERVAAFSIETVAAPSGCAEFDVITRDLDARDSTGFLFTEDDQHAIAITRDYSAFRISATTVTRLDFPGQQYVIGGAKLPDGTIWAGGPGELYVGRATERAVDLRLAVSQFGGERFYWVAAGPAPEGEADVFTMSVEGRVSHWDGRRWTELHAFDASETTERNGGLAWVGPKEAIAVAPSSLEVIRMKDGVATAELPPSTASFTAAASIPGFGTVIGNADGGILVHRGGRWENLPGHEIRLWPLAFAPYEDGFVYGTAFGNLVQYLPGTGYCPAIRQAGFDIFSVATVGRDLLLMGRIGGNGKLPSVFLRRKN